MDTSPTPSNKIIVNASPVVAVLVQPEFTVTMPVPLPQALSLRLRSMYTATTTHYTRYGFPHHDFNEWLVGILSDFAFGHHEDHGSVQDWLDRD